MTYDCFTFFNELGLLELRLHELAAAVDRFVLVEETQTHTNKPKPFYYLENRARFSPFHDKIIHIVVNDLPQVKNPLRKSSQQASIAVIPCSVMMSNWRSRLWRKPSRASCGSIRTNSPSGSSRYEHAQG